VIDRDFRQNWFDKGALDINARAHRKVQELIAAYELPAIPDDVVRALKAIAVRHAKAASLSELPKLTVRPV